jgi:hypothetical protein
MDCLQFAKRLYVIWFEFGRHGFVFCGHLGQMRSGFTHVKLASHHVCNQPNPVFSQQLYFPFGSLDGCV